jgi:hypothetical protein
MINNVVHHFTDEQNKTLASKVYRSLKDDGIYAIGDFIRAKKPGEGGVIASTTGLYFSLTSASGSWSEDEIESWMIDAGFKLKKPISLVTFPGWKMILGKKI